MKRILFFLAIISLSVTGCKKANTDPVVQTKTQLIARTWQMQSANVTITANGLTLPVYAKGGGAGNLIDYSKYQLGLTTDGKFTLSDGTQTQTGTWQLLNNDTQLTLTYADNSKVTYTVATASATNLDLGYQVLPTTQNATEKGYLAQVQALGQDAGKGLVISTKLIPQ